MLLIFRKFRRNILKERGIMVVVVVVGGGGGGGGGEWVKGPPSVYFLHTTFMC